MNKRLITIFQLIFFLSISSNSHAQKHTITELKALTTDAPEDLQTHQALIAATQRPEATIQQQSWLLFKDIQSEQTNKHLIKSILNLTDRSQDHLAAIEIIEVAKTFLDPSVKSALKKYQRSLSKSDPLAKWRPALHGGNAETGKHIFKNHTIAQCSKCHHDNYLSKHQLGPDAGPNLAGIAKRVNYSRRDLLESIMIPDATITEGFGSVTVEFEEGNITGPILAYQSAGLVVQLDGVPRLISHSDYKSLTFSKSTMPTTQDKLTLRETRDVIAFLASLTDEESKPPIAKINSTPFDLSEIKINHSTDTPHLSIKQQQKRLYEANCLACHQTGGVGNETFPPLAKSEWVTGDKETLIKMQLLGINGAITVRGKVYEGTPMPSNARLSDKEIAYILTYIRSNWGNNASEITAEEVAKVRKEIGNSTTPLDATTLIHPHSSNSTDKSSAVTTHKSNKTGFLTCLIILIIACLIPIGISLLKKK